MQQRPNHPINLNYSLGSEAHHQEAGDFKIIRLFPAGELQTTPLQRNTPSAAPTQPPEKKEGFLFGLLRKLFALCVMTLFFGQLMWMIQKTDSLLELQGSFEMEVMLIIIVKQTYNIIVYMVIIGLGIGESSFKSTLCHICLILCIVLEVTAFVIFFETIQKLKLNKGEYLVPYSIFAGFWVLMILIHVYIVHNQKSKVDDN